MNYQPVHHHDFLDIEIKQQIASLYDKNEELKSTERYLNMRGIGPDWQFAFDHGYANRPGVNREVDREQACICCLKSINKVPVSLCQNSKELQFLGYGFPLYFTFLKYAMIILLIEIINYTGIQLYEAIVANGDFCMKDAYQVNHEGHKIFCTSFMILFSNIREHVTTNEHIMRLSSFATLLFALVYLRDQFTKSWEYYDERKTSYSDFSVLIQNLPRKNETEGVPKAMGDRLRGFFSDKLLFPDAPQIAQINLVGQSEKYWELEEELNHLISEREKKYEKIANVQEKLNRERSNSDEQSLKYSIYEEKIEIEDKNQKIEHLEEQIRKEKERVRLLFFHEDIDCDTAIICFHSQVQVRSVIDRFNKLSKEEISNHLGTTKAQVCFSPEPSEINWEFIAVSSSTKVSRRLISWVVFVLLLGTLTIGIFYLFHYKSQLVKRLNNEGGAGHIVYFSIVGIMLFNKFILAEVIHHLVDFEMPSTGSVFQFSFMLKYSMGMFFTTALMTVLVEGLVEKNIYDQRYGLIEEETLMFFFSTFFVPIIWLVNPWYIWRTYQRGKHEKKTDYLTQERANKLMEDPQYLMGKRYGEVLEMLWFTFLYSCVIPFGSILILIGISTYYWVDKYNLLRKSSITQGVSGDLCLKALFLLQFVLVLKPGGELIFDALIRKQMHILPIIEISIGFLYLLLPMNKILNYFNDEKFLPSESTYEELKAKNFLSYQFYNPLTKQLELSKHFQSIQVISMRDSSEAQYKKQRPESQKLTLKRSHQKRAKQDLHS